MKGKGGLLITLNDETPTILDMAGEQIEIYLHHKIWTGFPTIWIKASKEVEITGSHLLNKVNWERKKLAIELKELKEKYECLLSKYNELKNN